jgi:hypothetical protein
MSEQSNRGLVYDPQDLERLLVSRENVGDSRRNGRLVRAPGLARL